MLADDTVAFYVLCGSALQKWAVSGEQERVNIVVCMHGFVCVCVCVCVCESTSTENNSRTCNVIYNKD